MTDDDFIKQANKELAEETGDTVRRDADGDIELVADGGNVMAIFTKDISIEDIVGASLMAQNIWLDFQNEGERQKVREFRAQFDALKARHGKNLTPQHIDDLIRSYEQFYATIDDRDEDRPGVWHHKQRKK